MNITSEHTENSLKTEAISNGAYSFVVAFEIAKVITTYIESNPNLSLRSIAHADENVSREYVRKLSQALIPDEKLNKDKVLRVLQLISRKEKLSEVLLSFEGTIAEYLKEAYKVSGQYEIELSGKELELALNESEDHCIAYHLAHSPVGVTEEKCASILGNKGVNALKSLEKRGLLEKVSKFYLGKSKETFYTTIETCHKVAQNFLRFYSPSHFGKKRNYILTFSGALNQDGVEKEQEIFQNFHNELQKLYKDSKYQGDIPCFALAAMDSFDVLKDDNE